MTSDEYNELIDNFDAYAEEAMMRHMDDWDCEFGAPSGDDSDTNDAGQDWF